MNVVFGSLRAKLAVLILCLILATTGAAIVAVQNIGKQALIEIGDAQSGLAEGALLDEWEKAAIAHGQLLARSLVSPLAALDASAMVRISVLARNEPGVVYVLVLSQTGRVLADGTGARESVGKVLTDRLSRGGIAAKEAVLQKNGALVDIAVPIRLGPERLGTVRIGFSPERVLDTLAVLKRQTRAAIDRAGESTLYSLAGMMAATGIVILAVGLMLARSFVSPLGALVRATRSFGAGDFAIRSELPPRNDEIGELAEAFDEMMGHIETHAVGLERLVEQRTRDLRESEARLRSIMDNADSVITLKDLDGRFLMVNRKFEQRQNVTRQEIAGKTIRDLHPDADLSPVEDLERRVIETGAAVQGEFSSFSGPGGAVNLSTKFPVRNPAGEIIAIGTINTDITEINRAQEELRESEARLHSIMDNADSVITLKDLDGRFLMVNRKFEKIHNVTQQGVIGKTLLDMYPDADRSSVEAMERRVIETGAAVQGEIGSLADPGRAFNLSTKFPVRNAAGEIVAIGTINADITEIKRVQEDLRAAHDELETRVEQRAGELRDSEERYRQLVNLSPDGIMVHADGVVVFVNPTFVQLLGADSANQIVGHDAIDYVPEDDRAAVLERRRSANERAMLKPRETVYQRLDGSLVPVERAIARITWQGKPAFLVLTRDITDRTQREEQLRQAQKMEAVGQLTGGIAHDFNNLLTVVLGYFDLRGENSVDEAALDRMADMANTAAQKGADLTQRLLAFARRQSLRPQLVDVALLVAEMEELIHRTLGAAITIRTECGPETWPCVVDSAQLENSLLNLCLNARDAMQDGGEIVIGTRNVELDEPSARRIGDLSVGRYVVLSVMDDGHGMTREMAARVFEPFFTTKTAERGSGLGLSMVYGFVRQSGGDVRIVTVPDGGTTIELYLPASKEGVADEPRAGAAENPPAAVSGTEKVLVVEDDPAVRELGVSMLTALGYDVVAASDGAAAVAVLERDDSIDIVFTDVVMPGGMSGPELARHARELRPGIKVVLTSGYPRNDDDDINLGKDELLPKPYSNVQLSACIRRVLDGGRAH